VVVLDGQTVKDEVIDDVVAAACAVLAK